MLNVICVKHGTKYCSVFVNKLYNMVSRHLTIPYNFYCFTDNPSELNPNIIAKSLPDLPIKGWWWKLYIFKHDHFNLGDTNLYIDLDMVIVNNIDNIINYMPGKFVGLRDVLRVFKPSLYKLGSAVMKWPAGEYSDIWNKFVQDPLVPNKFKGDQDWIWHLYHNDIHFFPDKWIQSYKWEIRSRNELTNFGPNGTFKTIKNPTIPNETAILAFHGNPQIFNVRDPVILNNWK